MVNILSVSAINFVDVHEHCKIRKDIQNVKKIEQHDFRLYEGERRCEN